MYDINFIHDTIIGEDMSGNNRCLELPGLPKKVLSLMFLDSI